MGPAPSPITLTIYLSIFATPIHLLPTRQNFYRPALQPHARQPRANFQGLPQQHTLTARPDAPEPWNIQTQACEEDTDNLRCAEGCAGEVTVTYSLKTVLVAGQCFQVQGTSGQAQQPAPPKGLQLTVTPHAEVGSGPGDAPAFADTLVMQNLGYFQLQANPGLWRLDVAQDAFSIQGGSPVVAVRAFTDVVHRVLVRRDRDEPDKALENGGGASVWNSLGSLFAGRPKAAHDRAKNDTIHVFSLATGHSYERLLRIMMLR